MKRCCSMTWAKTDASVRTAAPSLLASTVIFFFSQRSPFFETNYARARPPLERLRPRVRLPFRAARRRCDHEKDQSLCLFGRSRHSRRLSRHILFQGARSGGVQRGFARRHESERCAVRRAVDGERYPHGNRALRRHDLCDRIRRKPQRRLLDPGHRVVSSATQRHRTAGHKPVRARHSPLWSNLRLSRGEAHRRNRRFCVHGDDDAARVQHRRRNRRRLAEAQFWCVRSRRAAGPGVFSWKEVQEVSSIRSHGRRRIRGGPNPSLLILKRTM